MTDYLPGDEYVGGLFDNHARGMKGHKTAAHKTGGLFGDHPRGGVKVAGHKATVAASGASPGHKAEAGAAAGASSLGHKAIPHKHLHVHGQEHPHVLHAPKELGTAVVPPLHGPEEQAGAAAAVQPQTQDGVDAALLSHESKAEAVGPSGHENEGAPVDRRASSGARGVSSGAEVGHHAASAEAAQASA